AGDDDSAARLLAAVPPGVHASVNGDLFDDPLPSAPAPSLAGGAGALRRARERLDAIARRAGDASEARGHLEKIPDPADAAPDREPLADRADAAPLTAALVREGGMWIARFAGRSARVRHRKGLEDLAALLARPDEELHCLQLVGGVVVEGDAGPLLDDAA